VTWTAGRRRMRDAAMIQAFPHSRHQFSGWSYRTGYHVAVANRPGPAITGMTASKLAPGGAESVAQRTRF